VSEVGPNQTVTAGPDQTDTARLATKTINAPANRWHALILH
jgi:hypothetical protein